MFSLLEYIKIHRISLQQDLESTEMFGGYTFRRVIIGQIAVLDHLIKVAEETE
jgi:hypothetical protein